jgi:stage III sporulation protein AD
MTLRICCLAVLLLVLSLILRQWRAELLPFVRIAAVLAFATLLIGTLTPIVGYLRELTEQASIPSEHTSLLLKSLGLALLTQLCGEICRECGENTIADGVELIGKAEILLLSLPLIGEILSLTRELLSIGL